MGQLQSGVLERGAGKPGTLGTQEWETFTRRKAWEACLSRSHPSPQPAVGLHGLLGVAPVPVRGLHSQAHTDASMKRSPFQCTH